MSDTIDHCAEAARLRTKLTQIAEGSSVASARFGEDETKFSKANTDELRRILAYHEAECAKLQGGVKRSRYAVAARNRPF